MSGLIASAPNYTLGRGRVSFAPFKPNSKDPAAFRYLGNTPQFAIANATQQLDHFSMDQGIKQRDQSVTLEITRTATLEMDNIDFANLAFMFLGSGSVQTIAAAAVTAEPHTAALGQFVQLGQSAANPSGVRALAVIPTHTYYCVVTNVGATLTYVENVDYTVDTARGRVAFPASGSTITDGEALLITYQVAAGSQAQIISGSTMFEGALQFDAYNPSGANIDYLLCWCRMVPDGEYALKSDTWAVMKFKVEILLPSDRAAILANGAPFA